MEEAAKMNPGRKTVDQEMADLFHNFEEHTGSSIAALDKPWFYRIWDTNQKFLFLQNGGLIAAPLNSNSEAQIIAMVPNQTINASKRPVFMGTKDQKYMLNVKSGDRPQLQLVAGDIMELYKGKEEATELTFYNQTKGSEVTCSFESAAFPEFGLYMGESQKLLSPWNFKIWDISQQVIILLNNRLVAGPQNSSLPGHVMDVVPNPVLDSKKNPVFMAIKNRSQILSCAKSGDGLPELQLVGGDIMDLYKKRKESLEFTFYTQTKGSATTFSFESAAFPGWFLSTSPEPYKPLGLSQQGGSDSMLFYFKRSGVMNSSEPQFLK